MALHVRPLTPNLPLHQEFDTMQPGACQSLLLCLVEELSHSGRVERYERCTAMITLHEALQGKSGGGIRRDVPKYLVTLIYSTHISSLIARQYIFLIHSVGIIRLLGATVTNPPPNAARSRPSQTPSPWTRTNSRQFFMPCITRSYSPLPLRLLPLPSASSCCRLQRSMLEILDMLVQSGLRWEVRMTRRASVHIDRIIRSL